jgi:hypothetical protein
VSRRAPRVDVTPVVGGVVAVGAGLALYLLTADPPRPTVPRPADTCVDRVVYHGARLSDC